MDSIIAEWLGTYESRDTKTSYKYDIAKFQRWFNASNIDFLHITLKDLQRFGRTLGRTPADRRFVSAVKSFFRYCFNQGCLSTDVSRCLRMPRRTEIRVERKLSRGEVDRMVALAKGNDRLLLKLLFYLGLRLSEARKLQRSDIKNVNGELQFGVLGKGNKFRKVILSKKLSREIVEHLPTTGYLFRGRKGCVSRSQGYRRVKKIAKMVHSNASPHWFRHAFCYLSLKAGARSQRIERA